MRLLLLLSFLLVPLGAQNPVRVSTDVKVVDGAVGAAGVLRVHVDVEPGWHVYAPALPSEGSLPGLVPFTATSRRPDLLRVEGTLACSTPRQVYDEGFRHTRRLLEGHAWVDIPYRLGSDPAGGEAEVLLGYQACTEESCLPPVRVALRLPVGRGRAVRAEGEGGTLAFLGIAAGAGGAALLTPCVFPMVPVTLAFFARRTQRQGARRLKDALAFAAGIVSSFTALGLILAVLAGAAGLASFATHWAVNLGLAVLFLGFASALFGWVHLRLPARWTDALGTRGGASGSAFLMGLVFSVTSFTCTAPFVGTALVAASRGAWVRPALGMLAFSATFALPFLLLAAFPGLLARLPRSGAWMGRLTTALGVIELGAALKFVSNADLVQGWGLLPRGRFLLLWSLLALVLAGVLLHPWRRARWGRALAAAGALALAAWLGLGASGRPMGAWEAYLPPAGRTADGWHEDYASALAEAKRTGRPLFLDFTGTTCTNCRWMEAQMFPRPEVARALDGFVKARLCTDRQIPADLAHQKMQAERFGSVALPLYAVLGPDGRVRGTSAFTRDERAFLAFLAACAR